MQKDSTSKNEPKNKTVNFTLTNEEHTRLTRITSLFSRHPGKVAKILLNEFCLFYEQHGNRTCWPPKFGRFDGQIQNYTVTSESGEAQISRLRTRELCTETFPCEYCRAEDGTHKHGGDCIEQDELIILLDGLVLRSSKSSAKFIGQNLYQTLFPSELDSIQNTFFESALSGEPIIRPDKIIGAAWHIFPIFDPADQEIAAFRVILAPAYRG